MAEETLDDLQSENGEVFCICQQGKSGKMIACDNQECTLVGTIIYVLDFRKIMNQMNGFVTVCKGCQS